MSDLSNARTKLRQGHAVACDRTRVVSALKSPPSFASLAIFSTDFGLSTLVRESGLMDCTAGRTRDNKRGWLLSTRILVASFSFFERLDGS
jgi:hypothetical protein